MKLHFIENPRLRLLVSSGALVFGFFKGYASATEQQLPLGDSLLATLVGGYVFWAIYWGWPLVMLLYWRTRYWVPFPGLMGTLIVWGVWLLIGLLLVLYVGTFAGLLGAVPLAIYAFLEMRKNPASREGENGAQAH